MSDVFGHQYASAYDTLYQDKDYGFECQSLLSALVANQGNGPARILDLGCGTGQHAIILAAEGHHVTGVDRSESMLQLAQTNIVQHNQASSSELDLRLIESDLCALDLGETFDAVFMLFAVLGYQHDNASVMQAFEVARRHLRSGGLFLFDVWYGPAVLSERPGSRQKTVTRDGRQLTRKTTSRLDTSKHLCEVHFELTESECGEERAQFTETHLMRYFFPLELELFLSLSGFEQMRLTEFPSMTAPATDSSWNIFCSSIAAKSSGKP